VKVVSGLSSINVRPTISNGSFIVETNGKLGTITVFDILGKVVSKQVVTSSTQTVNVAKAGIYIIKVEAMV